MSDPYYRYFKLFTRMSTAIHAGRDPQAIIATIVAQVTSLTGAKGSIFWIIDKQKKRIQSFVSHGFEYRSLAGVDYDTLVHIFAPDGAKGIFIEDARCDERIPDFERLGKKRVGSISGINLQITGRYDGVLAVYFTGIRRLCDDEMELITALGEQGAIALNKALRFDGQLVDLLRQMVEGLVLAIEARDVATHGHSLNVARLAKRVAREMGLDDKRVDVIFHAGLLHDIGKIGLEDYILDHLGTLTRKEIKAARKHPLIGAGIVRPLTFLDGLEPIVKHHHERVDGSGYPDGLKGTDIPLGARIIGVCDVFETMLSGRKHIQKMPLDEALQSLRKGAGRHFDRRVVDTLIAIINSDPDSIGPLAPYRGGSAPFETELDDIALDSLKKACLDFPICF